MGNSTSVEYAARVDGLEVERRGRPVLADLSFTIDRGAIVGLLGPSGCGKTTLLRAMVGVARITSGTVTVLGYPAGSTELRSRIRYVTQSQGVYTDLTVRRNVAYSAALVGVGADAAARAARVEDAIATVDLSRDADRRVDTLSGGQASRVGLACALVGDPAMLVLDEPTVGLDPVTRADIWAHLRTSADRGVTLLVSSHVMDEAARCDDVLLLRDGRLLAHATPGELLAASGADTLDDAFLALIRRSGQAA